MANIKKRVLLIANDFGGGFNLFLFSKSKLKGFSKDYCFVGPSNKILNNKKNKSISSLNIQNYSRIYYSLSWDKKIEKLISKNKKNNNFTTYLVLDGWGDYRKKIFYKNKNFVPDNIISLDKFSFKLSNQQNLHKKSKIKCYPNILFEKFKKIRSNKSKNTKILYLTSPLIKKKKVNMIQNYISKNFKGKLEIKHHPKISSNKKEGLLTKKFKKFNYIFGHYSTALIYASKMGIKTFSINHTHFDIFKWKKYKVFSNFNIGIIKNKKINFAFKKIKNEYF